MKKLTTAKLHYLRLSSYVKTGYPSNDKIALDGHAFNQTAIFLYFSALINQEKDLPQHYALLTKDISNAVSNSFETLLSLLRLMSKKQRQVGDPRVKQIITLCLFFIDSGLFPLPSSPSTPQSSFVLQGLDKNHLADFLALLIRLEIPDDSFRDIFRTLTPKLLDEQISKFALYDLTAALREKRYFDLGEELRNKYLENNMAAQANLVAARMAATPENKGEFSFEMPSKENIAAFLHLLIKPGMLQTYIPDEAAMKQAVLGMEQLYERALAREELGHGYSLDREQLLFLFENSQQTIILENKKQIINLLTKLVLENEIAKEKLINPSLFETIVFFLIKTEATEKQPEVALSLLETATNNLTNYKRPRYSYGDFLITLLIINSLLTFLSKEKVAPTTAKKALDILKISLEKCQEERLAMEKFLSRGRPYFYAPNKHEFLQLTRTCRALMQLFFVETEVSLPTEVGSFNADDIPAATRLFTNELVTHDTPNLATSGTESPQPFSLRLAFSQLSQKEQKAALENHRSFYEAFEKSNARAAKIAKRNQRNYSKTMHVNSAKLVNLFHIMESDLFVFLKKYLGQSPIKLERFLNHYQTIPPECFSLLKNFFENNKRTILKSPPEKWQAILLLVAEGIMMAKEAKEDTTNIYQKLQRAIATEKSLAKVHDYLASKLVSTYLQHLNIPVETIDLANITSILPLHLLPKLLLGREAIKDDEFEEVFDEILKADLQPGRSFNAFATETEQSSWIGEELAEHNAAIAKELAAAGINTKKAFSYDEQLSFEYLGAATIDDNQLLRAIWQDILNVQRYTKQLLQAQTGDGQLQQRLQSLNKKIATFQNEVRKKPKQSTDKITLKELGNIRKENLRNSIQRMITSSKTIKKTIAKLSKSEPVTHFIEHSDHLATNLQALSKISSDKARMSQPLAAAKRFRVEQWDKNKLTTFFLGDYLDCCLATDGAYFSAMVQRRMDQGMQMHVVIDEETGEPVCGNWLFFGKDAHTGEVYVIANFFEMRTGYAQDSNLRDTLVNHLLHFTGNNYTAAVKAKGFLMRELTYGVLQSTPPFGNFDQADNIKLEKVGGFLELHKDAENSYYLDALLKDTKLYLFSPDKMTATITPATKAISAGTSPHGHFSKARRPTTPAAEPKAPSCSGGAN